MSSTMRMQIFFFAGCETLLQQLGSTCALVGGGLCVPASTCAPPPELELELDELELEPELEDVVDDSFVPPVDDVVLSSGCFFLCPAVALGSGSLVSFAVAVGFESAVSAVSSVAAS